MDNIQKVKVYNTYHLKYRKTRKPVKIIYKEEYKDRIEASKREYELKKLTRKKKELLLKK